MPSADEKPRILVPVLAGIGNAVMAVPLVRRLARMGTVTVAARTGAMADVFAALPEAAAVEVLGHRPPAALGNHRRLVRRLRPHLYVVPFPSNRWQYALLAATSGAGRIVMHDYPIGGLRSLRFLPRWLRSSTFVPAQRGLHDVVQNLRLAEALGISGPPEAPVLALTEADRSVALQLIEEAGIASPGSGDKGLILLQPGCGDTPVGREKRWPAARFAELADTLAERGDGVVVLEGPDERGVGRHVSAISRTRPPVLELSGPLGRAAGVLELARLYVGNDSGLAHVAAAVGTPAVTLFAAADPVRVAPYGCEHLVVTPPPVNGRAWQPRLMYPMDHPGPKLRDSGGIDWAAQIRLADVLAAVERSAIRQEQPAGRL